MQTYGSFIFHSFSRRFKDYEGWAENDYEYEYDEYDEDYYYDYDRYWNYNRYKSDFVRPIFFD